MALMGKGLATTALITLIVSVVAIALPVAKVLPLTQYPSLIVQLPKAFISMLVAMFTSAKAAKKFIHTPHKTQF